jgi:hypothetical protein
MTMRPFPLIPILTIAAAAAIHPLKAVTGDVMSAAIVALTLIVTVLAWFAGPIASACSKIERNLKS